MRRGFASAKQAAAYRLIKQRQCEDHQRQAYGMLPISARHPGRCGCGSHQFIPGNKIVKFRGSWWVTGCVEDIRLAESRAAAPFVKQVETREGWKPIDWSYEAKVADLWDEELQDEPNPRMRVVRKGAAV